MKVMLHLIAKRQKKQSVKIQKLDFELSPNIKLPHQLYSKKINGTENEHNKEGTPKTNESVIPDHKRNTHQPEIAAFNLQSNSPTTTIPSSLPKPFTIISSQDSATHSQVNLFVPVPTDRNLKSNIEISQLSILKKCNNAKDEKWVGTVQLSTPHSAASLTKNGLNLEENQ
ncbi:hypothetical protein MKX03_002043, partial [Papaver bracteatum]